MALCSTRKSSNAERPTKKNKTKIIIFLLFVFAFHNAVFVYTKFVSYYTNTIYENIFSYIHIILNFYKKNFRITWPSFWPSLRVMRGWYSCFNHSGEKTRTRRVGFFGIKKIAPGRVRVLSNLKTLYRVGFGFFRVFKTRWPTMFTTLVFFKPKIIFKYIFAFKMNYYCLSVL